MIKSTNHWSSHNIRHVTLKAPKHSAPQSSEQPPVFSSGTVVAVLLPIQLGQTYDYLVSEAIDQVQAGAFVRVPLGPRQVVGVVWGLGEGVVAPDKLKAIVDVLELPPLAPGFRRFIDGAARYTLASTGRVLRMAMSVPEALEPLKPRTGYTPSQTIPDRMTAGRHAVLEAATAAKSPLTATELATAAGVSVGVVRGLVDIGGLTPVLLPERPFHHAILETPNAVTLSQDQRNAADRLRSAVETEAYEAFLLDGVTGSGKTEVYFEAVATALAASMQVLVLLPEIALTSQWVSRFEARFGAEPVLWHSDISQSQRRRIWRALIKGEARVVLGARSALFLPFQDLGLIVVDEEHDASFKQEEGVIYHGRDMAVLRAFEEQVPIILASATPSLETIRNVDLDRYTRLKLSSRHGDADLPEIHVIDMVMHGAERGTWLAPELVGAVQSALERGEQSLLFLNRRGYAPLTLCRACGHRFSCPHCTSWLVHHKALHHLTCHHCGYQTREPDICPACEAEDTLVACGPGVERVAEEAKERFPDARVAIMTSDTVSSPTEVSRLVAAMESHDLDILIGTQMIAKGYHFPLLTTVGVVDADLGLSGGDLRAAERTYQLLHQVAGRAGRSDKPGHVFLQSYQAQHPVMQALVSHMRDDFYVAESEARRQAQMPPFSKLAALIISGPEEDQVIATARSFAATLPLGQGLEMFGPAPAPLSLLRGRHRWRLLLKAGRDVRLQSFVKHWMYRQASTGVKHSSVRVVVDIDPFGFL